LTERASRRALLLAAASLALPGAAAIPDEFAALPGQPILALASHPAVAARLRPITAGRQRVVAAALRQPGPPLSWEEGWLSAHAHGEAHLFLAFHPRSEQVALMLFEGNRPSLFIPPRIAAWPAALRGALERFNPEVAAQMRFA